MKMLNAMRFGQVDAQTVNEFKKLTRTVEYTDGIGPTQLQVLPYLISLLADFCARYPTRKEVDNANETQLRQIASDAHVYSSLDLPGVDSKGQPVSAQAVERLLERMIAAKSLTLKVSIILYHWKAICYFDMTPGWSPSHAYQGDTHAHQLW